MSYIDGPRRGEPDSTFITRIELEDYRSIAKCDVSLGPLTFLVGPNGSGKSNFLDALRFVSAGMREPLKQAVGRSGTLVRRVERELGYATVTLHFQLPDERTGRYRVVLQGGAAVTPTVFSERLDIEAGAGFGQSHYRVILDGPVACSEPVPPAPAPDRLYLMMASGLAPFRLPYECLSRMGLYSLEPRSTYIYPPSGSDDILRRDGRNTAEVLRRMAREQPSVKQRIDEYLAVAVPGLVGVTTEGPEFFPFLAYDQLVQWSPEPLHLPGPSMSDGTLRALAVLVALFQTGADTASRPPLIGIEEPEAGLHPFAAAVMYDALSEASATKQIIVSTHSPDLLDREEVPVDSILAVENEEGITRIARVDEASRSVLRDRLFTPGELLRLSQFELARDDAPRPGSTAPSPGATDG